MLYTLKDKRRGFAVNGVWPRRDPVIRDKFCARVMRHAKLSELWNGNNPRGYILRHVRARPAGSGRGARAARATSVRAATAAAAIRAAPRGASICAPVARPGMPSAPGAAMAPRPLTPAEEAQQKKSGMFAKKEKAPKPEKPKKEKKTKEKAVKAPRVKGKVAAAGPKGETDKKKLGLIAAGLLLLVAVGVGYFMMQPNTPKVKPVATTSRPIASSSSSSARARP